MSALLLYRVFSLPRPREHHLCQFVCFGVRLLYNPFHFQISSFFFRVFCSERNSLILHGTIFFQFHASCEVWCFLCSFVAFWPCQTTLIFITNNSLGIQKEKTFSAEVCLWKLVESLLKNPFRLKCNALSQKVSARQRVWGPPWQVVKTSTLQVNTKVLTTTEHLPILCSLFELFTLSVFLDNDLLDHKTAWCFLEFDLEALRTLVLRLFNADNCTCTLYNSMFHWKHHTNMNLANDQNNHCCFFSVRFKHVFSI